MYGDLQRGNTAQWVKYTVLLDLGLSTYSDMTLEQMT